MRERAIEPTPTDTLTDGDLLGRYAREGDEDAFRRFADRHRPLIAGLCRAMVGEAGDDAAQAVLLVAAERAGTLARRTCAVGWLYETARLVCRTHRRAEARRLRKEASAPAPMTPKPDPLLRPLLAVELDRLRPAEREALLLRYGQGLSLGETATALGTSEDAARMRVNRALGSLRARLGEAAMGAWLADLGRIGTVPVAPVASSNAALLAKGAVTAMKAKTLIVPAALAAALLLLGGAAALRSTPRPDALPAVPPAQADVLRPLAGEWKGTLTYENYDNPGTDAMPVNVKMALAPDSRSLNLTVSYPQYRGRSEPDTIGWTADPSAGRLYSTEAPRSVTAEGLDEFLADGHGTITTRGSVEETVKGVKATVPYRGTITLEGDTLTVRRETRTPLRMRNEMRLTRSPR